MLLNPGRRFAKRAMGRAVEAKTVTMDAVLWDIIEADRVCRVKIQGSNEYIYAHYPRNLRYKPTWLKPGNAVSIRFRQGNRGYVEVVGEGRAIPTPVSGDATPGVGTAPDMILTGLVMSEGDTPAMGVKITNGTYRIDGTTYSAVFATGYITMDTPAPMTMGEPYTMGANDIIVYFDAAPAAGYYRYDLVEIGTDGTLDYTAGTPATSDPVQPSVAADHVQVGRYVLVVGGATVIYNQDIGRIWQTLVPTTFDITVPEDNEMEWGVGDYPEETITVTINDQHDQPISVYGGYTITLTKVAGTGQVWCNDSGYDADSVDESISGHTATFKYQRDKTASPELSPTFTLSVDDYESVIGGWTYLVLLDAGGDPI